MTPEQELLLRELHRAERKRWMTLKADDEGFKLVYQGGHHDVWCNGTEHRQSQGGTVGISPSKVVRLVTSCDCAYWKGRN